MNVTVGIITCRRPEGLRRLLDALAGQKVPSETMMRVMVVDNACENEVREIVLSAGDKCSFPVEYYEEPRPGIVFARNKCVEEFLKSDDEYLLFVDDDEWPEDESWVSKMIAARDKYDADIIASRVVSVGEPGVPDWAMQLLYGSNRWQEGREMSVFYTGNLLITKPVLEKIQPAFDERFAMTGASDYHFALRCRKAGYRAFYTDALLNEDFPVSRAGVGWFVKRGYRSGIGFTRSHLFADGLIKALPLCLFMAFSRLARGLLLLPLGLLTFSKLRIVDGLFRLSSFAGSLAGIFGLSYDEYRDVHSS